MALASYAAAGISGADPLKTAITSCRLGLAAFIVPYMFVYAPQLLLVGSTTKIILATVTSMIGVVALAGSVVGWFIKKTLLFERIFLMGAALTLIKPGLYTDIIGFGLLALVVALQLLIKRKKKPATADPQTAPS